MCSPSPGLSLFIPTASPNPRVSIETAECLQLLGWWGRRKEYNCLLLQRVKLPGSLLLHPWPPGVEDRIKTFPSKFSLSLALPSPGQEAWSALGGSWLFSWQTPRALLGRQWGIQDRRGKQVISSHCNSKELPCYHCWNAMIWSFSSLFLVVLGMQPRA
jgi:hypothetical protein